MSLLSDKFNIYITEALPQGPNLTYNPMGNTISRYIDIFFLTIFLKRHQKVRTILPNIFDFSCSRREFTFSLRRFKYFGSKFCLSETWKCRCTTGLRFTKGAQLTTSSTTVQFYSKKTGLTVVLYLKNGKLPLNYFRQFFSHSHFLFFINVPVWMTNACFTSVMSYANLQTCAFARLANKVE